MILTQTDFMSAYFLLFYNFNVQYYNLWEVIFLINNINTKNFTVDFCEHLFYNNAIKQMFEMIL